MAKKTNVIINDKKYYRVRAKIGVDGNGKNILKSFYGESKTEAENKRDEYLDGIKRGLSVDYGKDTFKTVYENWFENVLKPNLKQSSYNRYDIVKRNHIQPALFYNTLFIQVKGMDIQKHINTLPSTGVALSVYNQLSTFYKYCLRADLVVKDAMLSVPRPAHKKTQKKEALTSKDREKLIEEFKQDGKLFIYMFAMFTGLRQGEILALTHNDIDFENKTINVDKSLNHTKVDGKLKVVITRPKTTESIRLIPIIDNLADPLKNHIKEEKLKHLRLGIPFSEKNLLFTSTECTPLRADHLRDRWKKYQEKAGIETVNFHGLRHTFCTILSEQGVAINTASILMGHADIGTTAKIYTHVDAEQKKKAIDKLNSLIKSSP